MIARPHLLFASFRLDSQNARLWRDDKEISLRPKSFEMLCYLVDHPGQLLTKAALLDALWPDLSVGDNLPASSIKELRKALGDDARAPQFIETVQRRGYRFIAPVGHASEQRALNTPSDRALSDHSMVGREAELAQFHQLFELVLQKKRITLFVTGEAGIGKTTCVNSFLNLISAHQEVRIARGQCIEQYGAGEPYMPVLEALSRLAREPGGERVRDVLSTFAPTWLAQMPELMTLDERSRSHDEMQGLTQQRMLREVTQALGALAAEELLVLVLEDLHWSDFSTLELISALARRSEPARMMIIATYRPAEINAEDHPLGRIKLELELHHNCEDLQLKLLNRAEIGQFLQQLLSGTDSLLLDKLTSIIHTRTDGNPLFMVNMIDYLLADRGLLVSSSNLSETDWAERLRLHSLNALRNIPQMIERNLDRLTPDEQVMLEAASVAGTEFSAAAVAAALMRPQIEVEAHCLRLSRHSQFVVEEAPVAWPDGTVSTGFRYKHSLYQEVLYDRLSVGQRTHLHRLIANRLEAAYQGCTAEVATELAGHYRRANLKLEAIYYLQLAGQRAISRAAVIEARGHFAQAIKLLGELPEGLGRDRRELDLHLAIAPVLIAVIGGWYAPETERAWARARQLCDRLGDSSSLFPAVFGMYALQLVRGKIADANGLAKQLLSQADSGGDASQTLYARIGLGITFYFIGDFTSALENLEICCSTYNFERHASLMLHYGFDAGVWALCYLAATYWQLGCLDKALVKSEEALSLANKQSHPLSLAQAELWAGILRQMSGEPQRVGEIADRLSTLSAEHGLSDWLYWADCLRGWVIAMQGQQEEGIEKIRENQEALTTRGLLVWRPYFHCLLADACLVANQIDKGMRSLDDAIAAADEGHERAHESQIYRFKGELLLKQPDPDVVQAQACFERALTIAQSQSAKFFELQAATSYARLLSVLGNRSKAHSTLEGVYKRFTEGFDTADLKNAKFLLDELIR